MPEPLTTPRTRLLGAAMIAAPALLLASTVAHTAGGGLGEDQAGGVIQVYAMAAFMVAVVGLTRACEGPFPRTAAVMLLIGAIGVAGGVAYGINSIYVDLGSIDLNENVEGTAGPLALQLPGLLFPLTFVVLGVALARAQTEPRWCAIALAVAGVLFPISRIGGIEILAVIADAVFLLALVPLGWRILQGRDLGETRPRREERSPAAAGASSAHSRGPTSP